jgi:hypothetical protein
MWTTCCPLPVPALDVVEGAGPVLERELDWDGVLAEEDVGDPVEVVPDAEPME